MNEFYSIADEGKKPVNAFQLKNIGKQRVYATFGNKRGSQTIYTDTKAEDYDQSFSYELRKIKPPYNINELLDFHFNFYINDKKGDGEKFIKQMKYVVVPLIQKMNDSKVYFDLLNEWIEEKKTTLKNVVKKDEPKKINQSKAIKRVFISYSKSDKDYRDRLISYLEQFKRNGLVEAWSDRELTAGEKWDDRIKKELEAADVVLFLCSQDMLSTDYIRSVEMKRAFEKEKKGETIVVPIIIKPCTWTRDALLTENVALPTKGLPVIDKSWGDVDFAYLNIFEGLEKLLKKETKAK